MNDLISVVIPVYNVEKYLPQCIESVMNQTYKKLEIILIDDGSPDNCGKICDDYAQKDKRIKIIHKENEGVSAARNNGIDIATGKYICFVDSDDYLVETYVEKLYKAISENNADIAVCCFYRKKGEQLHKKILYNEDMIITSKKIYDMLCCVDGSAVLWNKIFDLEMIKKFNIFFSTELSLGEDLVFVVSYAKYVKKLAYISDILYVYVDSNSSICKTQTQRSFFKNYDMISSKLSEIIKNIDDPCFINSIKARKTILLYHIIYDIKKFGLNIKTQKYKKEIKDNFFLFLSCGFRFQTKVRCTLMLYPKLYDIIRSIKNKKF